MSADIFKGTWALVTGASSGLGEVFARELAARGTNLILSARSVAKLDALARELRKTGIEARVIGADLGAPGGATGLCELTDATRHPITHLVNNAGYGASGKFISLPPEREAEMVRLNCEALVVLSRHFLPGMVLRGAGGVIHLASVAAFQPVPFMATYGATKAFVLSLSVALAEEVRSSGVRVMALCPGPVPTGFQSAAGIGKIAGPLKIATLSADQTVKRALRDYQARKQICIPGAVNRMSSLSRLLPLSAAARVTGEVMRRAGRKS